MTDKTAEALELLRELVKRTDWHDKIYDDYSQASLTSTWKTVRAFLEKNPPPQPSTATVSTAASTVTEAVGKGDAAAGGPEIEPVAWIVDYGAWKSLQFEQPYGLAVPLYAHPPTSTATETSSQEGSAVPNSGSAESPLAVPTGPALAFLCQGMLVICDTWCGSKFCKLTEQAALARAESAEKRLAEQQQRTGSPQWWQSAQMFLGFNRDRMSALDIDAVQDFLQEARNADHISHAGKKVGQAGDKP